MPLLPSRTSRSAVDGFSCPEADRYSLSQQFSKRIPASWLRFLWFMTCLGLASFALLAGQGQLWTHDTMVDPKADPLAYASLYLSTLPHTSLDAGTWVWSWVISELTLPAHRRRPAHRNSCPATIRYIAVHTRSQSSLSSLALPVQTLFSARLPRLLP